MTPTPLVTTVTDSTDGIGHATIPRQPVDQALATHPETLL
jgi:hypothetical protein